MARRTRATTPSFLDVDANVRTYLERLQHELNLLPQMSIISTADGPIDAGILGDKGDITLDIGSSATAGWIKQSSNGSHVGWVELDMQTLAADPLPETAYLYSHNTLQHIVDGFAQEVGFDNYEASSNLSPSPGSPAYGMGVVHMLSAGTYACHFSSSLSAAGNIELEFHFMKNGAECAASAHMELGVNAHENVAFSFMSYFASGDTVAVQAYYTSLSVSDLDLNMHCNTLTITEIL